MNTSTIRALSEDARQKPLIKTCALTAIALKTREKCSSAAAAQALLAHILVKLRLEPRPARD